MSRPLTPVVDDPPRGRKGGWRHTPSAERRSLARSPEGKRRSASVGTGQSAERRSDLISRAAPCQQLSAPCRMPLWLHLLVQMRRRRAAWSVGRKHGGGRLLTAAPRDLQLRAQQRKRSRCGAASCLCRPRGRRQIAACSSSRQDLMARASVAHECERRAKGERARMHRARAAPRPSSGTLRAGRSPPFARCSRSPSRAQPPRQAVRNGDARLGAAHRSAVPAARRGHGALARRPHHTGALAGDRRKTDS
jgi:hypothetical protein